MLTSKWKTFVFTAVLGALVISIFLNLFLYTSLRRYYTLLYAVEVDPLGLSSFPEDTDPLTLDDASSKVVFFGDSRAAQWPDPHLEGFSFVNRGIGNQTSAQVTSRFDIHLKPLQPDIVVVQVGVNDLKTIPLFPGREQQIITNCKTNLGRIVQDSLEMSSTVILTTIFPVGQIPLHRRFVWSDEISTAIDEVNLFIRSLAQDQVIILDTGPILSNVNGQLRREYRLDELHLNEAGYEALNEELINILNGLE